jgi:hypothetical protein
VPSLDDDLGGDYKGAHFWHHPSGHWQWLGAQLLTNCMPFHFFKLAVLSPAAFSVVFFCVWDV